MESHSNDTSEKFEAAVEAFNHLRTLYHLFKENDLDEYQLLGAYYNDSISLLKSFKNILIIGNTKLRQLDDVLQVPDVSPEDLNEAASEIGKDFLEFSDILWEFQTTWIEEHRKTTVQVLK